MTRSVLLGLLAGILAAAMPVSCARNTVHAAPEAGPGASRPQPAREWLEPRTGMVFIRVQGGCYSMGCGEWSVDCEDNEKPAHEVCVEDFWMGRFEVTQEQWQRVMGANPADPPHRDDAPVARVSWNDARAFLRKLTSGAGGAYTFRLPTEAEWEYACRSGGREQVYAGDGAVDGLAWYADNSGGAGRPVGTREPNGIGLFDMSGNVFEWCSDTFHPQSYQDPGNIEPDTADAPRVVRGGSWGSFARFVRCGMRFFARPDVGFRDVGFRVVRSP